MKLRNVCFTAWPEDIETIEFEKRMKYLVYGKEICPDTKKLHYQGYVEFDRPIVFGTLKKLLGNKTHLSNRNGTAKQAADYCKKDGDFIEHGEISQQGRRSDLDAVIENVNDKLSLKQIANANPVEFIKFHAGITKLKMLNIEPRNWITEVTVLWGPTGCGKSKKAREMLDEYWVWTPARDKWFDGYEGQENVIMEEFRGQLPFGMILSMLDRYECPVQYKGGTTEFAPKRVVITSPKHPKEWYEDSGRDKITQLLRRITKIEKL
jgi:hypothetical protein